MAFIPDDQVFTVGENVYIKTDVKVAGGRFTAGHKFEVTKVGAEIQIKDADGDRFATVAPVVLSHKPPYSWYDR